MFSDLSEDVLHLILLQVRNQEIAHEGLNIFLVPVSRFGGSQSPCYAKKSSGHG